MSRQRDWAEPSRLHAADDRVARQIEDRVENLRTFFAARLRDHEQHPRAVLDVARREQLTLEDVHDDRRLAAIETAGVAAPIELGEERGGPVVVQRPELLEHL